MNESLGEFQGGFEPTPIVVFCSKDNLSTEYNMATTAPDVVEHGYYEPNTKPCNNCDYEIRCKTALISYNKKQLTGRRK